MNRILLILVIVALGVGLSTSCAKESLLDSTTWTGKYNTSDYELSFVGTDFELRNVTSGVYLAGSYSCSKREIYFQAVRQRNSAWEWAEIQQQSYKAKMFLGHMELDVSGGSRMSLYRK